MSTESNSHFGKIIILAVVLITTILVVNNQLEKEMEEFAKTSVVAPATYVPPTLTENNRELDVPAKANSLNDRSDEDLSSIQVSVDQKEKRQKPKIVVYESPLEDVVLPQ